MESGRRNFLKAAAGAAGLALLQLAGFGGSARADSSRSDAVMLVNVTRCTGCGECYKACKKQNNLGGAERFDPEDPPELSSNCWITLYALKMGKAWRFRKHACMHCTDASCEQVCPTGAISHQEAAVVIDQDWCTGCGYCVQACPFGVPHIDEHTGTARKCTFCIDRTSNGQEPACADACPTHAIQFGKRTDLTETAMTQVKALKNDGYPSAGLYGGDENELGGLHVIYVLDDSASAYGLPEAPQLATSNAAFKWLSGIVTFGVAAVLPLWFLIRRRNQNAAEEGAE
jgi:formate dehydrogenase iron-sulfur subunit